jgi:hypothetical protein
MYTTSIIMTQTNKSVGWPPLIILNYEWEKIGSLVNNKSVGLSGQTISINFEISKL